MIRFLKYFAIAFLGQIVLNGILIALFEFSGLVLFGWVPTMAYFFVSDRIHSYWTGNMYDDGGWKSIISSCVPIVLYSAILAGVALVWSNVKNDDESEDKRPL